MIEQLSAAAGKRPLSATEINRIMQMEESETGFNVAFEHVSEREGEWKAFRRGKVGSSDAYDSLFNPLSAWLVCTGRKVVEETDRMTIGKKLEPAIMECFKHFWNREHPEQPVDIVDVDEVFQHPKHDWWLFTPDYFARVGGELYDLSIKNRGYWSGRADGDNVSDYAAAQSAHGMEAIPPLRGSIIFSLVGGDTPRTNVVGRNQAVTEALEQAHGELVYHIKTDTPPDLATASKEDLFTLFPNSFESEIELTEDALAIAIAYDKARAEEKAAASEKERLGNLIRGMLGENKKGLLAGWSITLPRIEKSSFDSKAFAEAHPDLYAQFVRTSAYKQLKVQTLKGKKK